jgi:hypothetical protein
LFLITFDIDWAPDEFIEDTLSLLDAAGVKGTFFATHATPLLKNIKGHEVGIHPNFLNSTVKNYNIELDKLMGLYPRAKGVRCHSYYENYYLLDMYKSYGLIYDSSLLTFGCKEVQPFKHWDGLVRIPVFWEDMVNCRFNGGWDTRTLPTNDNLLYVFDFHPTSVFLNIESVDRWEAAKKHYYPKPDIKKLREFTNPESSGAGSRVFLKKLLKMVENPSKTLKDYAEV